MAKILHVEDRKDWRQTVKMVLEGKGHKVTSFSELSKAQAAQQKGGYDWVVCDGSVHTKGDGVAWAEQLHAAGQKVVILSGDLLDKTPTAPLIRKADRWDQQLPKLLK